MRSLTVSMLGAAALAMAFLNPLPAAAQLPDPSPCCAKICNPDGSSTGCGPLALLDMDAGNGPELVSGCIEVGPLACFGGQVLSQDDGVLTQGCSCLLGPELCLNVGIPGDGPAQAAPGECTQAAVAACEAGGNVVVTTADPACAAGSEVCDNGVDDDGDGDVDCDDFYDCAEDPACALPVEDCSNGIDDDGDGDVDCDDGFCEGDPAC